VGDVVESACSPVTAAERLLDDMMASINENIMRPIWVSLKREETLARMPLASSLLSHPLLCYVSVALVRGSLDVPTLLAEVTRAREAATAVEASHIAAVLAKEAFTQEATAG
jgi:hypothetical protein